MRETTSSAPDLAGVASAEQVREWKQRWCETELGMSRDELIALMGPPTSALPDNLQWAAFEWTFNAKLNLEGDAYNLQWSDATTGGAISERDQVWAETEHDATSPRLAVPGHPPGGAPLIRWSQIG